MDRIQLLRRHFKSRSDVLLVVNSAFPRKKGGLSQQARDLLITKLARGPRRVSYLTDLADRQGISYNLLQRAAVSLGVKPTRKGFGPGSYVEWSIE